jgi:DNA-binding NarL/FixJ family response regulator
LRTSQLTRSLITLAHDDEIYVLEARAAGALGYLLERQPDAVLVRQLRLLFEGIPPLAPPIAARLLLNFTARPTQAEVTIVMAAPAMHTVLTEVEERVSRLSAPGSQISDVANELEISRSCEMPWKNIASSKELPSAEDATVVALFSAHDFFGCMARPGGRSTAAH